jgi:hypothetical protein
MDASSGRRIRGDCKKIAPRVATFAAARALHLSPGVVALRS